MEANELRIGNLLGLNDSEWEGFNQFFEFMDNEDVKCFLEDNNKHATVASISDEIQLSAYGVDLDFYDISEIKPIPLTEELLLKCEQLEKNCKSWVSESLKYIRFFTEENYNYDIGVNIFCDYDSVIDIKLPKYLHQLQNLYFALTGEEIIINL